MKVLASQNSFTQSDNSHMNANAQPKQVLQEDNFPCMTYLIHLTYLSDIMLWAWITMNHDDSNYKIKIISFLQENIYSLTSLLQ